MTETPLDLEMPRRAGGVRRPTGERPAEVDPVALVVVDVPLPHLDRAFEYAVPAALADLAIPGVRVKVPFAGQDVNGFVVARRSTAEHVGALAPLRRVISPEPVLTDHIASVAGQIAHQYAGMLTDVLRLAVPPRHARAEKALAAAPGVIDPAASAASAAGVESVAAAESVAAVEPLVVVTPPPVGAWAAYPAGPSYLRRLAAGEGPAAAWSALPGQTGESDWPDVLATAVATAASAGRGSLVVVPDHRDVARLGEALTRHLGPGRHVSLTADQGPQARYTAWLKVLRGHVRVAIGTRSAAFAPVRELGLVAWWDDGDDLHQEPRSPYPHVREVLLARARLSGAALLSGGFARSVAVARLVQTGILREIVPEAATRRAAQPRVLVAGERDVARDGVAARAHLPSLGWRTALEALASGPVLVQVPRRGYLPTLACQTCRVRARCPSCHGPLALPGPTAKPTCRWCGRAPERFFCPECSGTALRSSTVGASRTAEELGRAFPDVPVHTSGSGGVLTGVGSGPSLVIATPGAEPPAAQGYAAALLLDAWASLDRPASDAGEEAVRRWMTAAALVRPGGHVVLAGVPEHTTLPEVEALVRWAPEWYASRELGERAELGLPPAVFVGSLTGDVRSLLDSAGQVRAAAPGVEILGPLETDGAPAQLVVRAPWPVAPAVVDALRDLRAVRSARKDPSPVAVYVGRVDPPARATPPAPTRATPSAPTRARPGPAGSGRGRKSA